MLELALIVAALAAFGLLLAAAVELRRSIQPRDKDGR
jgi:hypothetical protein